MVVVVMVMEVVLVHEIHPVGIPRTRGMGSVVVVVAVRVLPPIGGHNDRFRHGWWTSRLLGLLLQIFCFVGVGVGVLMIVAMRMAAILLAVIMGRVRVGMRMMSVIAAVRMVLAAVGMVFAAVRMITAMRMVLAAVGMITAVRMVIAM